ncbi:MAG: spore germination protein [Clostridia bacterium]|nr:spore germination protein [Clostridia bacterium]
MTVFTDKISSVFGFDRERDGFELIETERGEPDPFSFRRNAKREDAPEKERFPRSVGEACETWKLAFRTDVNKDLVLRRFSVGGRRDALAVFMNGMASDEKINEFILKPLMATDKTETEALILEVIRIGEISRSSDMKEIKSGVMDGLTALFLDGEAQCLMLETHGYEKRSVGPAQNEQVVRGPKESFTESFKTNVTLIRRILHVEDLVVETRSAGGENNVKLALVYREGLANPTLVNEVKRRLARAKLKTVASSGITEQLIEDSSLFPLPQILSTERPDRAASHVNEGCVCVIVEGSPYALVMPITFFTLMNSPEDVYMRRPLGTLLRVVRYLGALVSVLLPGYFLALALYHQGMLTTEVLSTVMASRRMVFEPIGAEMILLLLIFQMIREAGLRVPGGIGQAIGIIGGLIMGQAAVAAHLASSVVLIIVAASGLGNFCIPDYSTQIAAAYFRIALVIAAWLAGLVGMLSAALLALMLLAGMKSFGVPFLSPFAPRTYSKMPFMLRGRILVNARAEDYLNTSEDKKAASQ